jgi:hypothetical protein
VSGVPRSHPVAAVDTLVTVSSFSHVLASNLCIVNDLMLLWEDRVRLVHNLRLVSHVGVLFARFFSHVLLQV